MNANIIKQDVQFICRWLKIIVQFCIIQQQADGAIFAVDFFGSGFEIIQHHIQRIERFFKIHFSKFCRNNFCIIKNAIEFLIIGIKITRKFFQQERQLGTN